jgi:hypothetical protein
MRSHAADARSRHERLVVVVGGDVEAVGVGVAEIRLDAALQAQHVLHPAGEDQAHAAALALEQAVEHGRARVDPAHHRGHGRVDLEVPVAQRVAGRGHEPLRLVLRRRLRLADDERARAVDDERVGHRPPGVDGQDAWLAGHGPSLLARPTS